MQERQYLELRKLIDHLSKKEDETKFQQDIFKELRLDIIHGQICLAEYTKWKQDQKQKAYKDPNPPEKKPKKTMLEHLRALQKKIGRVKNKDSDSSKSSITLESDSFASDSSMQDGSQSEGEGLGSKFQIIKLKRIIDDSLSDYSNGKKEARDPLTIKRM